MKKKTFLMSLPLLAIMLLSSCGGKTPAHTHTFGEGWKYDETNHWHECTANDGAKDGVAPHSWGEGKVTKEATCTEDGSKTYTCLCGATKTETITHSGHKAATEWQSDNTHHWHNCTNKGCYEEVDKAAHDFEEDMSRHEDPTCIKKGKEVLVCKVCQKEVTNELDMVAHDWDDGEITKEPDCENTGIKTFTCEVCKTTRTEVVDAKGHKWEPKSSTTAFQYQSIGTWEECSVCHVTRNLSITTKAPWSAFDLDNEEKVVCDHEDPTAWDKTTHTFTTSKYQKTDGVRFALADNVDSTRLVVEVTLTVDGKTSWGAQGSFFFLDEQGEELGSVFCLKQNPFQDASKHPTQFRTVALEGGKEVSVLSAQGVEFTYRFDFRGYDKAPRTFIINGANGVAATPDIISIKSIIVKESICGHPGTETVKGTDVASTCLVAGYTEYVCNHQDCGSVEYRINKELAEHTEKEITGAAKAYKYDFAGKYVVCSVCGEVLDDSGATPAPWQRVNPDNYSLEAATATQNPGHTATKSVEDGIVSLTGYYNNTLRAKIGSASKGRNIISITLKPSTWEWGGYCFYMYIYNNKGNKVSNALPTQFYSVNTPKWIDNGGKIYNEAGLEVAGSAVNANNYFTFEIDLTSSLGADEFISDVRFVTGYNKADEGSSYANVPTLSVKDITLKSSFCGCVETVPEEFSNGTNCGTRCATCKCILNGLVTSVEKSVPKGKDDIMSMETGVTFDGRDDCLKTTATAYTNNDAMGWAVNYKVYYKNLVSNARAAGKPIIKLNVYVDSPSTATDNFRFGWGVGNNTSGAQADHWNNGSTLLVGTNIVPNNSTLLKEDGSATTSGQHLPAKTWRIVVLDVSSDDFASINDFFIIGAFDAGSTHDRYPITTYISNVRCEAKA